MSEDQYKTVAGIVQFDVVEKEVSGKQVREAVIQSITSGNQVRVTIWNNYPKATVPLEKGDVLWANGKATQNTVTKDDGSTVTYNNISATKIAVQKGAVSIETERGVANATSSTPNVNNVF